MLEEREKRDSDNELLVDMIEYTNDAYEKDIPVREYYKTINEMLSKVSCEERRNHFRRYLLEYRFKRFNTLEI